MKPYAIIVDLDGTLCNTDHRKHFMESDKKDWKSFYEAMHFDTPHEWCLQLVNKFSITHEIIFVTGRPFTYWMATRSWLHDNCKFAVVELLMRKDGDYRQDAIVKREIYVHDIEPHYDVQFCIEDRKQVVDMWRSLGLICLQCAEGDF